MQFSFETDDDTKRLFEIVVHFLQVYFGYDEQIAVDLVNQYYAKLKGIPQGDVFYHREGAWYVALRVHYIVGLHGDPDKFTPWTHDNGYVRTPSEALTYFKEHYLKK
jgi:hypothetical protein